MSMPVTGRTFTLDEARKVLARRQCEEDVEGGPLTAWSLLGFVQQPKRLEVLPLGHDLAKIYDRGFRGYKCLRCGARFEEVVSGEQHQLPVGEPVT